MLYWANCSVWLLSSRQPCQRYVCCNKSGDIGYPKDYNHQVLSITLHRYQHDKSCFLYVLALHWKACAQLGFTIEVKSLIGWATKQGNSERSKTQDSKELTEVIAIVETCMLHFSIHLLMAEGIRERMANWVWRTIRKYFHWAILCESRICWSM